MPDRKPDPPRGVLKAGADPDLSFRHERFFPSEDLAVHIEHFWLVEWDLRGKEPYKAETLPHPSVHMTFGYDGESRIGGPSTAKFSRTLEGEGGVIAAKFTPAGFYSFVRRPVSELADRSVEIAEMFGGPGRQLVKDVYSQTSEQDRIRSIETFLRSLSAENDPNVPMLNTMVYSMASDREILKVEDLVERHNISKRTLQRLCAKYIGVSPKWIIQRYRLHEAAEQIAKGTPDYADLALELGYSDQAHFVRDFKAIVGVTPAVYARSIRS